MKTILGYHERTKHHPERYARSLGYLDWNTQPIPFRRFDGARLIPLDERPPESEPSYEALFARETIAPRPVDRVTVSQLLYDSLALSAWKAVGASSWSLRVNPSSGNLHPTEGYLVIGPVEGLTEQAGVFHYAVHEHALEERFVLSSPLEKPLFRDLPDGAFLVGLCSIYWRESWKYGERAFRYCQHDVGHAIAAVTIAARVLGWRAVLLERPSDASIAGLLGIDGQQGIEAEHPDCLLAVLPCGEGADIETQRAWSLPQSVLDALARTSPAGTPNQLSAENHPWEAIDTASEASIKIEPSADDFWYRSAKGLGLRRPEYAELSARRIVRQRRSALAMDGRTEIARDCFYRMLHAVMPEVNRVVFQTLPWRPCVHLALFVHRVSDLAPGLYLLVRERSAQDLLHQAIANEFIWEKAEACPSGLPLYRLYAADLRDTARVVSCQQDIASDGVFSLGMLAEFEAPLAQGAWFYKRLFWEAGVIGQVLYLESEAAGIQATGIGCFFDDLMHEILGIGDHRLQSLYHFTVGGPLEDPRLRTESAYAHLGRS